jgi:hypothetical protein
MKFLQFGIFTINLLLLQSITVVSKHLKGYSTDETKEEMRKEKINSFVTGVKRKDSLIDGDLDTDGHCWIHENGKFCFQGEHFQSVTIDNDEIFVEEIFNQKKYSYSLQNVEKLRSDYQSIPSSRNRRLAHAISDTSWLDALEGVKYDCHIEDFDGSFHANDKELLSMNGDSSSFWRLNDWIISVDSNLIPITIFTPAPHDNPADSPYMFLTAIDNVEAITSDINGCDPDTPEGDLSPPISVEGHARFLQVLSAHDESISDEEYFSGEAHRKLDWLADFTAEVSNTQWCGPGTDNKTTPCPNKNRDFDFNADNACRRHDHGKKYVKTTIGLPRLECFVDHQLKQAGGHNWAVAAVYGDWGGAQVIGCYNYESYKCWKKSGWYWKYVNCGRKWKTKLGPYRYSGRVKKSGYMAKDKNCPHDNLLTY